MVLAVPGWCVKYNDHGLLGAVARAELKAYWGVLLVPTSRSVGNGLECGVHRTLRMVLRQSSLVAPGVA